MLLTAETRMQLRHKNCYRLTSASFWKRLRPSSSSSSNLLNLLSFFRKVSIFNNFEISETNGLNFGRRYLGLRP